MYEFNSVTQLSWNELSIKGGSLSYRGVDDKLCNCSMMN